MGWTRLCVDCVEIAEVGVEADGNTTGRLRLVICVLISYMCRYQRLRLQTWQSWQVVATPE